MEAAKKVFSGPATKREGGKKLDKKVVGPLKKKLFRLPYLRTDYLQTDKDNFRISCAIYTKYLPM